ncbi:MAG: ATP-dependent 6-phosphofructokinase [Eubacteriales bacterium]|nr:ATP-dependent 6-phosphofructokinase [Eubacteriales bacterium]
MVKRSKETKEADKLVLNSHVAKENVVHSKVAKTAEVGSGEVKEIRRIGVLTSGGDAPGMNGVIRAVTRAAAAHGIEVMGVRRGFHGLWRGDIIELKPRDVSDILQRGGTTLMTARSKTFMTEEGVSKAMSMADVFGLDALICVGGDGTGRGALDLAAAGLPVVLVPATIDNDMAGTDETIGFDTAMNTVISAVDKIRDSASSHERCSVVEVMGRNAGFLAFQVGVATGAEVVLIPEIDCDFDQDVVKKLLSARNRGKQHFIIIVAEGVRLDPDFHAAVKAAPAIAIAEEVEAKTGIETNATILGYVQRGGNPSLRDRYLSSMMGIEAVETLLAGRANRLIASLRGQIVDIDLSEALAMKKEITEEAFKRAGILSL